ncbi:MAG: peptidylprolyl isomerase [Candidatus Aminicenantes bacterium]|nr:peptidylprolyl isomerase [Candidatus Aminicenantes bacterium]
MKMIMLTVLSALLLSMPAAGEKVICRIETAAGDMLIEVYPEKAPLSTANFLRYVDSGLYNGSTFFRVLTADIQPDSEFKIEVIQGGDLAEEKCFPPIAHETTKMTGLRHLDGVVSMARAAPGTASCSFFICVGVQPELDHGGRRNPDGQGFAAFGRVTAGMDTVKQIQAMEQEKQYLKKPLLIISIRRLGPKD